MSAFPQRILVPTDLSDFSKGAAAWALMFQRRLGSRITLLYANQPYFAVNALEGPAAYALPPTPDVTERMEEELSEFRRECFHGEEGGVEVRMEDAAPADAIISTAKAIDADLVLMGTHGRRGWRRALLGSVTESVVRAIDRPLMSVPATSSAPAIGRILCPVNFTPIARQALDDAVALAAIFDAQLLVVHVADAMDQASVRSVELDFAAWVEPGVRNRCTYSRIVAHGDAAEQTLGIAERESVDLIVIGAQHRRFTDTTVIGTTTERVVRFATRPVWTVVSREVEKDTNTPHYSMAGTLI